MFLDVEDTGEIEMDFRCAKELIELALPDHQDLNKVYSFNPTCENLAKERYTQLKKSLNVDKVVLWESSDAGAIYP